MTYFENEKASGHSSNLAGVMNRSLCPVSYKIPLLLVPKPIVVKLHEYLYSSSKDKYATNDEWGMSSVVLVETPWQT